MTKRCQLPCCNPSLDDGKMAKEIQSNIGSNIASDMKKFAQDKILLAKAREELKKFLIIPADKMLSALPKEMIDNLEPFVFKKI